MRRAAGKFKCMFTLEIRIENELEEFLERGDVAEFGGVCRGDLLESRFHHARLGAVVEVRARFQFPTDKAARLVIPGAVPAHCTRAPLAAQHAGVAGGLLHGRPGTETLGHDGPRPALHVAPERRQAVVRALHHFVHVARQHPVHRVPDEHELEVRPVGQLKVFHTLKSTFILSTLLPHTVVMANIQISNVSV